METQIESEKKSKVRKILIISVLFVVSCTGAKKAADNEKSSEEFSVAETLKRIEANRIEFKQLNSNIQFDIKSSMFNGGASAKLRMVSDSIIWMSISKLGFEVGRMLITPDSLFAVERIQKTFVSESIDQLANLAGINLDFKAAEDLLAGNALLHPENNLVQYIGRDSVNVTPVFEEFKLSHTLESSNFKLVKSEMRDETSKKNVVMDYSDYQPLLGNQIFSYFRKITVDDENEVSITFKNTELNTEKSTKFAIPSSYTRREL